MFKRTKLDPLLKTKFAWNKKQWWKISLQILVLIAIIYGLETIDYFYVGTWWGSIFNSFDKSYTLNLQLPVDKIMPWATWIFPYYIAWPFIWFIAIPLLIYFSGGKHSFYRYSINSLIMYVISMFIYALIPTTCTPAQFIPADQLPSGVSGAGVMYDAGNTSWNWASNKLFHSELIQLSQSGANIWGSAPSFHNYWAALFIFFGLQRNVKWYFKLPMVLLGALITISTLTLHQHNLADVLITYTMVGLILLWEKNREMVFKFENWYNKLFRVNDSVHKF